MTWSNTVNLRDVLARARAGAERGLLLGSEHVLEVSNQRVPLEEGTLERSGKATQDPATLTAAVSYNTPYAVVQHEDPSLRHDSGRSAKFLESALVGEAPTLHQLIATQIRREIGA